MLELTDTELTALAQRHSVAIDRAVGLFRAPVTPGQDVEVDRQNYMLVLLGALIALGVPHAEAQPLAVEAAMLVYRRVEAMSHPQGHA